MSRNRTRKIVQRDPFGRELSEYEEEDAAILQDGERRRVSMQMRDSADSWRNDMHAHFMRSAVVTDGSGSPLGLHRPGPRHFADGATRDAARQAYDGMIADVSDAWKNPGNGFVLAHPAPATPPAPAPSGFAAHGFGSRSMRGQQEGDQCTINGAPGHLHMVNGTPQCVPDRRSDSISTGDARADAWREMVDAQQEAWRQGPQS